MKATDIFFSYSRKDLDRIEPIIGAFKKHGWEVFYDRDIDAGADWRQVIEDRLQTMYAVIVAWSTHSLGSPWVKFEATAAAKRDRLFSIQLDTGLKLPKAFRDRQAVDFSRWKGDANDPIFKHVLDPLEGLWTLDNGMALIRDLKVSRPLKLRSQSSSK